MGGTLIGTFHAADDQGPALATAERELSFLDSDLAKLGSAAVNPIPESHAAELVDQRTRVAARVGQLRAEIEARQSAAAGELVDKILAGDAEAREQLAQLASARPSAWPLGFAEALRAFSWKVGSLDAIGEELRRGIKSHEYDFAPIP